MIADIGQAQNSRSGEVDRGRRWAVRWLCLALLLLAFALRVYTLGAREFWFDEALTANVSSLGWDGILSYLSSAPFEHPPLYFLSLYPWQQLAGTSEFAFRFYSLFWGVLFVALLYAFVRRLSGEGLALLVALLAAVLPFLVAYSQEARMYSLLPVIGLLALWAYWRAFEQEQRPLWWLVYLALLILGLATHYFFAFFWLAGVVYLVIDAVQRRKVSPWAIGVHALLLIAAVAWLVAAPGVRLSLVRVWQGETSFGLTYKLSKIMPTLVLAEVQGAQVPPESHLLAAAAWILVLAGAWYAVRSPLLGQRAARLLLTMLVVPLVASLLVPYGVLGRHLGYVMVSLPVLLALGLIALRHLGRPWLALGVAVVLFGTGYGLLAHYASSNGDFGRAFDYIDQRGKLGDLVVLTQPGQDPLATYYNEHGWPIRYVPSASVPLDAEHVAETMARLARMRDRLWLGPTGAWTADPDRLVEQWLVANAYQADKTWFPDSSSVALYLTGRSDLATLDVPAWTWGGRIRLQKAASDPLRVRPGEAFRLRFTWRPGYDLEERYSLSFSLTDSEGVTWAERLSEPCGGWCPTDTWQAGQLYNDLHALLVPPGTPPGTYELQAAWLPLNGGPSLQAEVDGDRQRAVTLATVRVLRSVDDTGGPWAVSNPIDVTFDGEVKLLGHGLSTLEPKAGETLRVETHWRAIAAPSNDYALLLELVDENEELAGRWRLAPFADAYPTSVWQAGEYVRGQHLLLLPTDLPPGRYRLQLALLAPNGRRLFASYAGELSDEPVALGMVEVLDRPRSFSLPEMEHTLRARLGVNARLVGYDLDASHALPGDQVNLTLYWQADGPMVRPFKVFTHLLDGAGEIVVQHDTPPGQGCCPATTWVEGEVIVDPHVLPLPADLVPGTYYVVAGMYDEPTDSRLPAYGADGNKLPEDRVQIAELVVDQPATPAPPLFEFDYKLYMPLVARE